MDEGICRCVVCKQVVKIKDTNHAQEGHVCKGQCTDEYIIKRVYERREAEQRALEERIVRMRKQWWER